MLKKPKTITKN